MYFRDNDAVGHGALLREPSEAAGWVNRGDSVVLHGEDCPGRSGEVEAGFDSTSSESRGLP